MTPDIGQHPELIFGILALIGAFLRLFKNGRLHSRKGRVSLLLTVSDTEENSSDCHQNTNLSEADGLKMDSNEPKQQHTKQQEKQ